MLVTSKFPKLAKVHLMLIEEYDRLKNIYIKIFIKILILLTKVIKI